MVKNVVQSINGNNNSQTNIDTQIILGKLPSLLEKILPTLADIIGKDAISPENDTVTFDISEKISWNNLSIHKETLDEYGEYGNQIDALYNDYESGAPGFKKRIYNFFKLSYRKKLTYLCDHQSDSRLEIARKNSDLIFQHVVDHLSQNIRDSQNLQIASEELDTCAVVLTCHAFINCKILEKPKSS